MAFTAKFYHEYTIEDDDEFRRQHEDEIENRREVCFLSLTIFFDEFLLDDAPVMNRLKWKQIDLSFLR